jgi:hypothetical protein
MRDIAGAGYVFVMASAVLIATCGTSAAGAGGDPAAAPAVTELPVRRGFYVASDTACDAASHATLLLKRRDGFNGARDSCDFRTIERTGPRSYRVSVQCADHGADTDSAGTQIVEWEVPDTASFTLKRHAGRERSYRHCEQSSLPDPWRDNDVSDLIGQDGE